MPAPNDLGRGGKGLYDRFQFPGTGDPNLVDNSEAARRTQGSRSIERAAGPFTLTGDQNDFSPTGASSCSIVLVSASHSLSITGWIPTEPGEVKTLLLSSQSASITIANLNNSSSASYQFNIGTNISVPAAGGFTIYYDPNANRWRLTALFSGSSGSGDVVGPAGATDNAVARYDGITGKLIQNSSVIVSDAGDISAAAISASQILASGTVTAAQGWFTTPLPMGAGGLAANNSASARTNLGLVIGADVQSFSTSLQALSTANVQSAGIQLLTYGTTAAIDSYLGLVVGTTVQSYSDKLQTIAGAAASTINFNDSSGTQRTVLLGANGTVPQVNASGGLAFVAVAGTGTVTNIDTGFGLTGGPISTVGTASISLTAPPAGYESPINVALSASVSSNVLIVSLLTTSGAQPTPTNPILIPFRGANQTSGAITWAAITSNLNYAVATTTTFGSSASQAFRIWALAGRNTSSGDLQILLYGALSVSSTGVPTGVKPIDESAVVTPTVGAVTSAGIYGATAAGDYNVRILGYLEWGAGLSVAGTFATGPTKIQLLGPGVKRPGDVVQKIISVTRTQSSTTSSTFIQTNNSTSISLSSPVNIITAATLGDLFNPNGASTNGVVHLFRDSADLQIHSINGGANGVTSSVALVGTDKPNTTAAVVYGVRLRSSDNTNTVSYPATGSAVTYGTIQVEEIMG